VRLDRGEQLIAVRQNMQAADEAPQFERKRIRLAWAPEHTYVLEEKPMAVENSKER
jgi:hypothetical protein